MVDLALVNGDISVPSKTVTGPELVRQRVLLRLRQWTGEWILDVRTGLPWWDWMRAKPAPIDEIVAAIRTEIATTPGVRSVDSLTRTYSNRTLSVVAEVTLEDGTSGALSLSSGAAPPGDSSAWVLAWRPSGRYLG